MQAACSHHGQVQPIFTVAVAAWFSASDSAAVAERLSSMQFQVSNLSGPTLAAAAGNTIWLDATAAGLGWFLDATPADDWIAERSTTLTADEEFDAHGRVLSRTAAASRVDLLTVVLHSLIRLRELEVLEKLAFSV